MGASSRTTCSTHSRAAGFIIVGSSGARASMRARPRSQLDLADLMCGRADITPRLSVTWPLITRPARATPFVGDVDQVIPVITVKLSRCARRPLPGGIDVSPLLIWRAVHSAPISQASRLLRTICWSDERDGRNRAPDRMACCAIV